MRAVQGYGFRCYEIFPWAVTYMLSFNSYHVNNSLNVSEVYTRPMANQSIATGHAMQIYNCLNCPRQLLICIA